MAYAEDLAGLSAEQLDVACRKARQESEFMPVSAAILSAHKALESERYQNEVFLGPRMEWNAELEAERIEREKAHKNQLANGEEKFETSPQQKRIARPPKSAEEQKEELRKAGWIQ